MKKIFTLLFAVMASVGTMFAEIIERVQIGELYYNLDIENKTAEVTSQNRGNPKWSTRITIVTLSPAVTYNSEVYSVTSIGSYAFEGCTSLTSVTIPNSVTSIGDHAFECCGLTTIDIPSSVTIIGESAFERCSLFTSITIPYGVTNIGNRAFDGCWGLTSIEISNSVTSIGNYAFNYCPNVTSLTIPNSVTSIGSYAFEYCISLTSLTIPNSVTSIGEEAFGSIANVVYNGTATGSPWGARCVNGYVEGWLVYQDASKTQLLACSASAKGEVKIPNSVVSIGDYAFIDCDSLTSIDIPNSVTSIGYSVFFSCNSLTSITIPNSVTSIGDNAFESCTGLPVLDKIRYTDTNYTYLVEVVNKSLSTYTINEGTKQIGESAFKDCTGLTSITIPNSVTSIGHEAFCECEKLKSIIIGNSVTSIGYRTFYRCTSLESVIIGNSVTSIEDEAFMDCTGLSSIKIPNSVESIGHHAFSDCTGLTDIIMGNSVTSIGSYAFENCTGLTSIEFPNSVKDIGVYTFLACKSLVSVTISNSVTSIGYGAFVGCKINKIYFIGTLEEWCNKRWEPYNISNNYSLYINDTKIKKLVIPENITTIGYQAFSGCSSLISVTIPNSVTSIGDYAFNHCSSLTSINIPNSVTSIGGYAFSSCTGLTSITIPNSVTSIGLGVFNGCTSLTDIYVTCGDLDRVKRLVDNSSKVKYQPLLYTITTNAYNGTVTSPQNICDALELTVTPDYDYHFVQWSDGNTENPRIITLTQDTTFTAICKPNRIYITYFGMNGKLLGVESVPYGSAAKQTGVDFDEFGYTLTGWDKDITNVTSDMTVTALYQRDAVNGFYYIYDRENRTAVMDREGDRYAKMKTLNVPNHFIYRGIDFSVVAIGANAFEGCDRLTDVVLPSNVEYVHEYAFSGCSDMVRLTMSAGLRGIEEYAFNGCKRLEEITVYAERVPDLTATSFDAVGNKKYINVYVPDNRVNSYKRDEYWSEFNIVEKTATTVAGNVDDVKVESEETAAQFTWPAASNAASYTIQITKEGELVCTLIFNANGQLAGIAFAPGRGANNAPAASIGNGGMKFTVTGLDAGTHYAYTVTTKDAQEQVIATYEGVFDTFGSLEGFDLIQSGVTPHKVLRNGQILILRGEKTYTLQGQSVK